MPLYHGMMTKAFPGMMQIDEFCNEDKTTERMIKVFKNQIPGSGKVRVLLYGDVGDGGKVDSGRVVAELMELAAAYGKIDVHIHSKGGDVFSGIAIYNALRTVEADITIYIDGLAASIAGVIALCGKPLYMNRYARLMLHRVSGGSYGTADQLRQAADLAETLESDLASIISGRIGKPADEVKHLYFDGAEHWISAQQALEMGLIDGIIDTGEKLTDNVTNTELYNYFINRLNHEPQNHNDMAFIDELKKRPSFSNLGTEDDMLRHITTMENEAAKVPALEAKVNELRGKLEANCKLAHEAFLNQAVAEGKLTQEQVPVFLNLMASDEENTRKAVEAMPKRGTTRALNFLETGGAPTGMAELTNMSWDEIDKAERLAELKSKYPELYNKKFNEKFGK